MKFHYMSDLHLEFGMSKPMLVEGENLILAGDITCLRCLNPVMNDAGNRKLRDRTLLFFAHMLENFKRVFYLTGNHESYNFNIDLEAQYIEKYLPGVIHLNNNSYELDDETVIMGGTLWTDMNNHNPIDMNAIGYGMNDFRLIYTGEAGTFTPEHAYQKHLVTKQFLTDELEKYKNKKVVVATHHAPTSKGVNPFHSGNAIDHGYYSDLEQFIMDREQIKYWVFGHTHIQKQIEIDKTKVVSNAKGYDGYEDSARTFNPNRSFKV